VKAQAANRAIPGWQYHPVADIRLMTEDHLPEAAHLGRAAFAPPAPDPDPPVTSDELDGKVDEVDEMEVARLRNRVAHFMHTDPAGSWVALERGRVTGVAQSFVRGDMWVLSLLAVEASARGSGTGKALLEASLTHGDRASPGLILASSDPAALALYTGAGFDLHPALVTRGPVRRPPASPSEVRTGGPADLPLVADIDARIRVSERTQDVAAALAEPGAQLLVDGETGYAVVKPGRVIILGALADDSAVRLLRRAIAMGPPSSFEIGWLTAPQQWAIRELVAAGVELSPRGPVMVRGLPGPPAPYVPSGGYG